MKKLISLALALVLTLALAVPAGAAETKTADAAKTVGVILNGKAVDFPDAKPEKVSGRTMVPVAALMEMMDGEATIQDGLVTCRVDNTTFTFRVGEKTVTVATAGETVTADGVNATASGGVQVTTAGGTSTGKTETIQLDVPTYIKDGRTYVPVRFFAQALGYEVLWDGKTNSAVLVDKNALIADIDKNFTILNAALAQQQSDPTKNYKSTMTYDITMNLPADGTTPAINAVIKIKMDMLTSADALEMTGSMDASSLVPLLELEESVKSGEITAEMAGAIKGALSSLTFQFRFDLKTMTYYINCPVVTLLTQGQVPAETWMKLDLKALYDTMGLSGLLEQALDLSKEKVAPTVGNMTYLICLSLAQSTKNTAPLYTQAQEAATVLSVFLGDSAAKKDGSATKFHFGKTELDQLAGEKVADSLFSTFSVDLLVNGGAMTVNFDIKTVPTQDSSTQNLSLALKGKMTMSADKGNFEMVMDMGAAGKATYVLNLTMTPTTQKPAAIPPTGAKVMDLNELLGGLLSPMPTIPVTALPPATPATPAA